MKKEYKVLIYNMINNIVVATIKIFGGITLGLTSLFADGLHTLSDFIINIISMVGAKLSRKRATKHHPYGFGRIEYLTNLFIGMFLFLLGIYIFIQGFFAPHVIPQIEILWFLVIPIILKGICIGITYVASKKLKSKILLVSAEESTADIYSTIGVIFIAILLQFAEENPILMYLDIIGGILISFVILKTAFKIVFQNSLALIGEVEENGEEVKKVKEFLTKYHNKIKAEDIYLIKYGSYYKLQLNIELDSNMTLNKITRLENTIKKDIIKHRSLKVKYVTIHVSNDLK